MVCLCHIVTDRYRSMMMPGHQQQPQSSLESAAMPAAVSQPELKVGIICDITNILMELIRLFNKLLVDVLK